MGKHELIMRSREGDKFALYKLEHEDTAPWYIPKETREYLIKEADNVCNICGKRVDASLLHIDHVHPVVLGGNACYHNLQVLCRQCNLQKSGHILDPSSYRVRYVRVISFTSERAIANQILDKLEDERA